MSSGAAETAKPRPPAEWNELELAVRRLLQARDAWRRRAIEAEKRASELESTVRALSSGELDPVALSARVEELTAENQALRERLESASKRVRSLIQRLDVLEEPR